MPIQEDLHTDIAVLRIARQTGLDPDSVVGKLIRVWKWARLNSPDGFMPGTIAADADDVAKHDGFCAAMVAAGWLEVTAEGLVFPKWDVWNSGGARRRLLEQRKKAAQRASKADVPQLSRSCPDDVPDLSRCDRDRNGTREDKSREEKSKDRVSECATASEHAIGPTPPEITLFEDLAKRDLSTHERGAVCRDFDRVAASGYGDLWLASARQMADEPGFTFSTVTAALRYLASMLNRCRDEGKQPHERTVRLAATGPPDTDSAEDIRAIVAEAFQRSKQRKRSPA